ncbi:MFS transporter [Lentzea sp. NBRC 105346]|uniref:MFS transporter n=1 Tax=Lentzea sp. NBRC 105346 TaxID=3032205 RepID=UPI0024A41BF5|nr:MFS transporter [Lentzea sp. NBRC 105346]GLZ35496.1 MFS transporter [Lentzea sp. NBRC 105346]
MWGKRDLSLVVSGAVVTEFGNAITMIVLLLWATPISPLLVAGVLIAELLPIALGAPVAGWLVDRFPNRRLIILTLLAQGAATAVIAAVVGNPVLVLALVFVSGCGRAITAPAMSALIPHVAGEENSTRAYAWMGTGRSLGLLTGATGGALLAGQVGYGPAMLIDGGTFVIYALILTLVRAERRGDHEQRPSALAGIRHVRTDKVLLAGISGLAMFIGCIVVINVADPAYVRYVLNGDEFTLGALQSCWMVGVIAGNRIAARLRTEHQVTSWLGWAGVGIGVAVCIPAAVPHVAASAIGWLLGGTCNGIDNVTEKALVRMRTPDEMRGRVFAAVSSVTNAANLLGTAAGGLLMLVMGPRWVFAIGGAGAIVTGIACLIMVRKAKSPAEAGLLTS